MLRQIKGMAYFGSNDLFILLISLVENPPACFGGYVPFLRVDYFTEKCREVYFCTDDYSDAAYVISNFGIYSIFYELGSTDPDPNLREEYLSYIETCRNNLETALANLNILMPATQESIKALAVGVSLLPSSGFSRTSSILIKTGYARTGDLETICRLDPSVNSHAFMPNTWISPILINGA
jgi:hypothetical protein